MTWEWISCHPAGQVPKHSYLVWEIACAGETCPLYFGGEGALWLASLICSQLYRANTRKVLSYTLGSPQWGMGRGPSLNCLAYSKLSSVALQHQEQITARIQQGVETRKSQGKLLPFFGSGISPRANILKAFSPYLKAMGKIEALEHGEVIGGMP